MWSDVIEYLRQSGSARLGRDFIDVFITYYIIYRTWLVLRGTRAMQVVVGFGLVLLLYGVAELLKLTTVLSMMSAILSSALLIVVVVFQNDIRRALMRVGSSAWFDVARSEDRRVIDEVVEAATILARHRTGALIAFEQEANLDEFVGTHKGRVVDAAVSRDLLVTLFVPEGMNKLHDGAVIVRGRRVAKAGVFFPMPDARVLDESFGSRHRAALGITEETDAIVIVVSEERGSISFCFNGNIVSDLDGSKLRAALDGVFAPQRREARRGFMATLWRSARRVAWPRLLSSLQKPRPRAGEPVPESVRLRTRPALTPPSSAEQPTPLRKRPKTSPDLTPIGPTTLTQLGSNTPAGTSPTPNQPLVHDTGPTLHRPTAEREPERGETT